MKTTLKHIKICTGPGCRAWEAEKVTQRVGGMKESFSTEGYRVQFVSCINKCGGGVCVQVNPGKHLVKLRKPEEVLSLLPKAKNQFAVA